MGPKYITDVSAANVLFEAFLINAIWSIQSNEIQQYFSSMYHLVAEHYDYFQMTIIVEKSS